MVGGCSGAQAPAASGAPSIDPPDSVHVVLTRWYDAFATFDSAGVASALADDFLLVEDTTLVSADALLTNLMRAKGKGHQTAALRDFHTVMEASVAWTTFRNHEEWIPSDGSKGETVDFIETVVFRKQEGAWRIARYHATRLNP
jgi:ketosteroid isomerase-like protein